MREDDAGRPPAPERANPLLQRLAKSRAPLLAPALLFAGALGGLAARRRKEDTGKDGGQDGNGGENEGGGARGRRGARRGQNGAEREHTDRSPGGYAGKGRDGKKDDGNH